MEKRRSTEFVLVLAALLLTGAEPASAAPQAKGGASGGLDAARGVLKEFRGRRFPPKKKLEFCGLDLNSAPKTKSLAELPDLYEHDPCDPNILRLRKNIVVARHPEHWCDGVIYYAPARNLHYVSLEPGHPGRNPFYGPFEGKPWKRLKMFEPKPAKDKCRFAVYLVADDIDTGNPDPNLLDQLHLAPEPIITEKDLLEYDWDRHIMKLAPGVKERLPSPGVWGIPFLVIADGERCYLGAFWSAGSSYMPKTPIIYVGISPGFLGSKNSLQIRPALVKAAQDARGDRRIRKVLESLGFVKPMKAVVPQARKTADSLDAQLRTSVDFSHWARDTTFGQAIDDVKNSVNPPMRLIVFWKDLYDNAAIDQDTTIGMDGISGVPLGVALKSLLMAVAGNPGQLGYIIDAGVITVATKDSLKEKWQTRVYDIRDLF
ncbi:MAG: hypothetical protein JXN61_11250 [Sedimentisphaerales bacterium]|nr:hypothetical protein [Sedimentisphaerales bacterium]